MWGFSSVFAFKQAKEHILFQMIPLKMCFFEIVLILGYNLKIFKGPALHPKGMKFWNWSPTTIWHNIKCVAFYFSKSLHPTVYGDINDLGEHMWGGEKWSPEVSSLLFTFTIYKKCGSCNWRSRVREKKRQSIKEVEFQDCNLLFVIL